MKPEVKVTWLTALKSGEYKKGKMKLRNNVDDDEEYTYCCLGVLCEEYRKETGLGAWEGDIFFDGNGESHITVLTRDVAEWAGLSQFNPMLEKDLYSLAELNDMTDTFTEVINAIEEQL
jgi:hypothetical protein